MSGREEHSAEVDASAGQGVQVGDGNTQVNHNYFGWRPPGRQDASGAGPAVVGPGFFAAVRRRLHSLRKDGALANSKVVGMVAVAGLSALAAGVLIGLKVGEASSSPHFPLLRFAPGADPQARQCRYQGKGTGSIPSGYMLEIFTSKTGIGPYISVGSASDTPGSGSWLTNQLTLGSDPTWISAVLVPQDYGAYIASIRVGGSSNSWKYYSESLPPGIEVIQPIEVSVNLKDCPKPPAAAPNR